MVVTKIDHSLLHGADGGRELPSTQSTAGQSGMGQVPDRLEAPQDRAFLEGFFSSLSSALVSLYEWVTYLIQLPFQLLFGKEEVQEVTDPGNRPGTRGKSAEKTEWKKEDLLTALENDGEKLKILLEVAYKASEKSLKVKRHEAFEVIKKFGEKEPEIFETLLKSYAATAKVKVPDVIAELLDGDFKFRTFYEVLVRHELEPVLQEFEPAHICEKLDILQREIGVGADRALPQEKEKILAKVRILVGRLPESIQNYIARCMKQTEEALPGGIQGFSEEFGKEDFKMKAYLKGEKVHLALMYTALPQVYLGTIYAGIMQERVPITSKLELLRRGLERQEEPEAIANMLRDFETHNPIAYIVLMNETRALDDKASVLAAIEVIKGDAPQRIVDETRRQVLAQLSNANVPIIEQLKLLQRCCQEGLDREALQAFASVLSQRKIFASRIVGSFTDEERYELSQLAKVDIEAHPSRASMSEQARMSVNSLVCAGLREGMGLNFESDRTHLDKEAIRKYLSREATYATLSLKFVQIGFRGTRARSFMT